MRILVVEDERKVAGFIRQGLEEEGHAVQVAAGGEAALELILNDNPYDLIVLDVMLPCRDGFRVLETMRKERIQSPVLLLTARDTVRDKVAGLDLGADDYLTKPSAFAEFLARVRALLRRGTAAAGPVPEGTPRWLRRSPARYRPLKAVGTRVRSARWLRAPGLAERKREVGTTPTARPHTPEWDRRTEQYELPMDFF